MKNVLKTFLIAMLFVNASVFAQELTFNMTNSTGVDLLYIQVSDSDTESWGEDIIPGDVFLDGDTFEVTLPVDEDTICLHDLKVTDFEENYVVLEGVDLCEISDITLVYDEDGVLNWQLE